MNMRPMKVILRRTATGAAVALIAGWPFAMAIATAPTVPISQVPMTVQIPAHPQVLLAVGNSQSMDGDLSGAIYTGSGALTSSYSALNTSSSPVNYTIPSGFTPPLNPGSGGVAPYTVNTEEGWKKMADAHVDAIITDDPVGLLQWLRAQTPPLHP